MSSTSTLSISFSSQAFIQLALDNQVLRFGEFALKSGRISPYFFNAGLLATGEMLSMLADGYAQMLTQLWQSSVTDPQAYQQSNTHNPIIFGAAYKGIPFVSATAQTLWQQHGINVQWGYNRKEAKDHGEGGVLVGADLSGQSVWVIDDVMTAGTAMREVVALLAKVDAQVAGVVVALDRKEKGQGELSAIQELQQQLNVPVKALIDIDDIIDYLVKQGDSHHQSLLKMRQYREQYGV